MIQGFYSAAIGAQQQMKKMDVQANNIANVNTYGFKAERAAFGALMYGMVEGTEGNLPRGSGAAVVSTGTDFSDAAIEETGRKQDYAIIGEGYFGLYDPATEEISFTRDGSFALGSFQQLVEEEGEEPYYEQVFYLTDGEGRQVLDRQGYPIVVGDGGYDDVQPVGVFTIQYEDGLQHVGSGRFVAGDKNGQIWISQAEVRQGYLETSNADLATELGKVIEAQRAYSYALRMVTTADEVETTVVNLAN
ncbi:flagellar hook-basal body protein [Candidatus Avoscillospira sp. LCP25S3_F1]|uniref:flagellar hook-basal body protein n=1 Tax=Candidatus Avoscillospira sp. LCP25S3_F1 TaxID=3438825 RepID=UPI003F9106D7